jgi:predicted nucleic acid-binding protein
MHLSAYALRVIRMARMNIIVSDEVEKKFREVIFRKYGMKKGNITKAVEEAINEWIKQEKKKRYANAK